MRPLFRDRSHAGRVLAEKLEAYADLQDLVVLALPRGGVPVAYEVATSVGAPLDIFVVRKLGLPGHEELAMGAIASGGVRIMNDDVVDYYAPDPVAIEAVIRREEAELQRRERSYRGDQHLPDLRGKTVILVDDGLATGSTMRVAVEAVRREGARRIVVAVPVAATEVCQDFRAIADDVVCAATPEPFSAVGVWYVDFHQTTDAEVRELLERANGSTEPAVIYGDDDVERTVTIPVGPVHLEGTLGVPEDASGVVLFAHGSGSSRFSPRNRYVARVLRDAGLATLLVDLLTSQEERIDETARELRFDIRLLADRLVATIDWLASVPSTHDLRVGLFGASTGGGAALVAAADRPERVRAVVSRGGRPDLAEDALPRVSCPTLLLVGERDEVVIELNEAARARMRAPVQLMIISRATHLFEEPGALEEVASQARNFLVATLAGSAARPQATSREARRRP